MRRMWCDGQMCAGAGGSPYNGIITSYALVSPLSAVLHEVASLIARHDSEHELLLYQLSAQGVACKCLSLCVLHCSCGNDTQAAMPAHTHGEELTDQP